MEKREHPRVQLPLEVEVTHPAIGSVHTLARDVSAGGLFVMLRKSGISVGAKLKVTALNVPLIENKPTPTVQMEVKRIEEDGLGLSFVNKSSKHLWDTVEQLRTELAIGRDYFQVFQAGLLLNDENRVLVVQQHGKWLFPGDYLVVGQHWEEVLESLLQEEFGIDSVEHKEVLAIDSAANSRLEEAAVFSVFHRFRTHTRKIILKKKSRYRNTRWVARAGDLDELTFSHPYLRQLAAIALAHAAKEDAGRVE